jgi:plasmid maintenance system antidote protein VapI
MANNRIVYDGSLMRSDLDGRGWLPTELAKKARVADITVSRFLRGKQQSARTAKKLARALGYATPRRYLKSTPSQEVA